MTKLSIASAQFKLTGLTSFQQFEDKLNSIVAKCTSQNVNLLVLPEYFSMQLVGLVDETKDESLLFKQVASFTPKVVDFLLEKAQQSNMIIVAGSMPVVFANRVYNDSYVLSPAGDVECQGKLNMTTYEKQSACISERNQLKIFDSKFGKFAVNICYDIEFPEIARVATENGAQFIAVPSWTDDIQGFWRVRYCAQARCVENHIYVIHSSIVGSLGQEPAKNELSGQSAILSPVDKGFPLNGILAEGKRNEEDLVVSELDLNLLSDIKSKGATTPCKDRKQLGPKLARVDEIVLRS